MKHRLFQNGILWSTVLVGTLVMRMPMAEAAETSLVNATPLSPYVQHVVDRAEAGFSEAAKQTMSNPLTLVLRLTWMDRLTTTAFALIDTDQRLIREQSSLFDVTPCLHYDLSILEALMERARQEKNTALQAGAIDRLFLLLPMERYLNERALALLQGAADPSFSDRKEGLWKSFDPLPGWCCPATGADGKRTCSAVTDGASRTQCTFGLGTLAKSLNACTNAGCIAPESEAASAEAQNLCPFDTDYLPPMSSGYGCDTTVLRQTGDTPPASLKKEMEALEAFDTDRDAFLQQAGPLKDVTNSIALALGEPLPNLANFQSGMSTRRTHQVLSGCQPNDRALPSDLALTERRSPFTIHSDEVRLLPRLLSLWHLWGLMRVPPANLRMSFEWPTGSPEQKAALARESGFYFWFDAFTRNDARQYLKDWSVDQFERESLLIAKTTDAPRRLQKSLLPFQSEVNTMIASVASPGGSIRAFVASFAQFLRVSCVFRPCAEKLDRILRIDLQDACFPYASGLALTEDDPGKVCREKAGL